jgi:dihydroflavonol-4-reductase
MMHRTMPAVPDLYFSAVDVRDIALGHVKVLWGEETPGNRYQGITFSMKLRDCCGLLASKFGPLGYSVPTGNLPGFLLKIIGFWDATVREVCTFEGACVPRSFD